VRVRLVVSLPSNSGPAPVLCYVTDRRIIAGAAGSKERDMLGHKIEAARAAGVDWIQIREKDLSGKDCAQLTREAISRVAKWAVEGGAPVKIVVNDRLDIAISEGAGGVHFGERGLPVSDAKRLVSSLGSSREFLVGKSCHSREEAKFAEESGADYIFFGPIFATPAKAIYGAPQGLERLADVCREISIPVMAIGGITLANYAACLAAGAAGIAAIRLFQDATDLRAVVANLRKLSS
jgi:thiamine-phosphate pyrophosphorylase